MARSAPPRPALDAALAVQMRYWARIAGVVVVLSNVVLAAWLGEAFRLALAIADIAWAIALVLAAGRPAWLLLSAAIAVVELSLVGWAGAATFMLLVAAFAMRLRPAPAGAATLATWAAIAIGIAWFGDRHPPTHEMRAVDLAFAMANTFLLGALMRGVIASRARAESLAEQLQAAHTMLQRDLVTTESLAAAQERTRIAQELHDNLGHSLAAAHVQVQLVRRLVGDGDADIVDAVDLVGQSTRQAMHELRDAVALLRARSDGTTLGQRIRALLARMPESVLAHQLRIVGEERPLSPAKEFALYRALQEAMTNVVKHARARSVLVVLEYDDDGGTALEVVDDGVGTAEIRHGFGLRGITERLQSVGGRLEVASLPSSGFRLRVEVDVT